MCGEQEVAVDKGVVNAWLAGHCCARGLARCQVVIGDACAGTHDRTSRASNRGVKRREDAVRFQESASPRRFNLLTRHNGPWDRSATHCGNPNPAVGEPMLPRTIVGPRVVVPYNPWCRYFQDTTYSLSGRRIVRTKSVGVPPRRPDRSTQTGRSPVVRRGALFGSIGLMAAHSWSVSS